jgi:hypothetical protein
MVCETGRVCYSKDIVSDADPDYYDQTFLNQFCLVSGPHQPRIRHKKESSGSYMCRFVRQFSTKK